MHHGWNGRRIHSSTFGWLGYRIADADDSDRHRLPDWLDCGRSVPQVYKDKNGALESKAGFKGLCRKAVILLIVLMAYRFDMLIHVNYIRDAVIIGFISNEAISIVENAGLMGIPMPPQITKAIEILTNKSEEEHRNEEN